MKNLSKISVMLMVSLLMVFGANAQQKQGAQKQQKMMHKQMPMLPDLSEAQQKQMKAIHVATMKKIQPLQNSLMEKKAHLHTLSTAEKADQKAINKQIDEISALQASMQKIKASSMQEVRSLLTEDQRIMFDSKPKGMKGKGNCDGNGPHAMKMRKGEPGQQRGANNK